MATSKNDQVGPSALISPSELARLLGVNVFRTYHRAGSRSIPHYRLGNRSRPRIRFLPSDIAAWLEERRVGVKDLASIA
jgi:hypothetical protein